MIVHPCTRHGFVRVTTNTSPAHENRMNQELGNTEVAAGFRRIVFDMLVAQVKGGQFGNGPPTRRSGQ